MESLANRVARKKAQFELVQRTKNYNAYSTNVGVVMPKIRSDDVRWLWKYLKQQYVTAMACSLGVLTRMPFSVMIPLLLFTPLTNGPNWIYILHILVAVAKSPRTSPTLSTTMTTYPRTPSSFTRTRSNDTTTCSGPRQVQYCKTCAPKPWKQRDT